MTISWKRWTLNGNSGHQPQLIIPGFWLKKRRNYDSLKNPTSLNAPCPTYIRRTSTNEQARNLHANERIEQNFENFSPRSSTCTRTPICAYIFVCITHTHMCMVHTKIMSHTHAHTHAHSIHTKHCLSVNFLFSFVLSVTTTRRFDDFPIYHFVISGVCGDKNRAGR